MPTYRDEAVVLRTHKLGEADRIITMLSRRHGKIRAVAKGVRRTTSKFGARLEPFSHIDLQLAVGRTLDVITQVESLDAFGEPLTNDYPAYTAGQVMLETADRLVVEEAEPAVQQYLLLVGALRALNEGTSDGRRASDVDLGLLPAAGTGASPAMRPRSSDCARCGVAGPHRAFSPALGGAVCERCRPAGAARPAAETLALLGALLEGRWRDTRQVPDQVAREASGITAAFAGLAPRPQLADHWRMSSVDPRWPPPHASQAFMAAPQQPPMQRPAVQRPHRIAYLLAVIMPVILLVAWPSPSVWPGRSPAFGRLLAA